MALDGLAACHFFFVDLVGSIAIPLECGTKRLDGEIRQRVARVASPFIGLDQTDHHSVPTGKTARYLVEHADCHRALSIQLGGGGSLFCSAAAVQAASNRNCAMSTRLYRACGSFSSRA